jgi:hypothetical protein
LAIVNNSATNMGEPHPAIMEEATAATQIKSLLTIMNHRERRIIGTRGSAITEKGEAMHD